MELKLADLFTAGEQGRQAGRQNLARKGLAAYFQGDTNAIQQVYANDPTIAFAAERMMDQRKESAEDRLGKLSGAFAKTRDPMIYNQWRQVAIQTLGAPAQAMPEALNTPEDVERAANAAASIAQAYGNVTDDTPADIRTLKILRDDPELAELDMKRRTAGFDRPQLIQTESGYAWATPQGARPLTYEGAAQPAGPQLDQSVVQRNLAMLGALPGVQMTSGLRTPQRNERVGGVPNSQHLRGTAGDYVVPQHQKAAFIQQAQAQGLQAIDEGDHIHVQVPRGGVVQPRTEEDKPSIPSGYRMTPDGNLEAIPGGPADPNVEKPIPPAQRAKLEATKRKEEALLSSSESAIDQTVKLIDDILAKRDKLGGVTGLGSLGAKIPGTPWADVAAKLDTLRGRSAFGALQRMRAESPTGGALGSVTERELALLQNSEAQLQDTQSPESLARSLQEYRQTLLDAKRRMRQGLAEAYEDAPQQSDDIDALIGKYL